VEVLKGLNDIVLATRRIGVSVEAYFQYFGEFDMHDGIRRLSVE
jgi:hypothetical protein